MPGAHPKKQNNKTQENRTITPTLEENNDKLWKVNRKDNRSEVSKNLNLAVGCG
jgi:hypothetical protein